MRLLLPLILALGLLGPALSEDAAKTDPRYPFRTDFANADLPWYQPKPLEFPPHHSDRRISGELVSADFVLRRGQFRATKTGELVDFTMPPYGAINYLNAEADLRDISLGTFFLFFLNQDRDGGFTRLATMQDQFTMDDSHSFSYRLDELKPAEGKLLTTKHSIPKKQPDLGKRELIVTPQTRIWKGSKQIKLTDLTIGDELLYNLTGKAATDAGRCLDIWAGADTHKLAKETQRKKFNDFTQHRGLPGWIDKTDNSTVTLTFFSGDAKAFKQTWMKDIVVGKEISLAVANDQLRTWNPPVDKDRGTILEVLSVPTDGYGSSGVRIVVKVTNMLEGFRKGRVVRAFCSGWNAKDQFYGESLMGYGFARLLTAELLELPPKEYPDQFPFRTDYSNRQLSWYKVQKDQPPPPFAEHLLLGEIVNVDAAARTGQFRADRTGALVDFALLPSAKVRYLNADATLADLPLGTRCRFDMFQDDKGAFTLANFISDEFSFMAVNQLTYGIESLNLAEGKLIVTRLLPLVKNYNGDMEQPPPVARTELRVSPDTKIWKGDQQIKPDALTLGDAILVNITSDQPGQPARCTEIWVGADTHKAVTEARTKKLTAAKKK